MSLSHRKQSIDLQNKSIDWFLHEKDIGRYRVKEVIHERVQNNELDQNLNDSNKNETLCTWVLFVNPFETNVALHIETNDWFLYETQHWAKMG